MTDVDKQSENEDQTQLGLPVLHLVVATALGVVIILLLLFGGAGEESDGLDEVVSVGSDVMTDKQIEIDLKRPTAGTDKSALEETAGKQRVSRLAEHEPQVSKPASDFSISDLESASSQAYTLQLLAAYREDAVSSYTRRYSELPVTYYKTIKDGFPWFVAVTGLYETRDEALAASKTLPNEMIARNPWPKPLKQVHKELKAAR